MTNQCQNKILWVNVVRGFTMIELMITVAIAAILLSLAVPSFSQMISNNNTTKYVNNLIAGISQARQTAISEGNDIVMCSSYNADSANAPTCSWSQTRGWKEGFLIYSKPVDQQITNVASSLNYNSSNDTLVAQVALGNYDHIDIVEGHTTRRRFLAFDSSGLALNGTGYSYEICDGRESGSLISISVTGRINRETSDCTD